MRRNAKLAMVTAFLKYVT